VRIETRPLLVDAEVRVLPGHEFLQDVSAFSEVPADIIELRIDMFRDLSKGHVEEVFRTAAEKFGRPIIATVRDLREGGEKEVPDRVGIYRRIAAWADAFDTELSLELGPEVKEICRETGKLFICSHHNFRFTPDDVFLDNLVSEATGLGCDIVKVAAMAQEREDLVRLLAFTLRHRNKGIITMAMGDSGLPSRVFSPILGSLITYGYLNRPAAPGQLSVPELIDIFKRLRIR
ncbi:MAG: type I 3-dehydroquinate dehydratase, partial [Nitrospirales bacterium]|nr:type I 3-dehydroquinate dehydratase [Nitrospirales bacterium]